MSSLNKICLAALLCAPLLACAKQAPEPKPVSATPAPNRVTAPAIETAQPKTEAVREIPAATVGGEWKAGEHYLVLDPAQPTSSPADVIEVAEVFMYSCPHCFSFEPFIKAWKKNYLKDDVQFVQMPALFNKPAIAHARAFYALQAMDALTPSMHQALFEAIHVKRQTMRNFAEVSKVVTAAGVDAEQFKQQFDSFAVDAEVRRAQDLADRYGVNSVPSLIINGRYLATGKMAGSEANLSAIINFLVAAERTRLSASN